VLRYFLVRAALEDGADGTLSPLDREVGNFLVERGQPGVSIINTWNSLSMRLSGSHDLLLENVHLEPEGLTDYLDSKDPAVLQQQAGWGLPLAAMYLGIGQGARTEAVRFAKKRQPNSLSHTIASVPHIQEKVAKMELLLLQAEAIVFGVAEEFTRDPASVPASQLAVTKYVATNYAAEVCELAMRLVGGASLSLSLPMQRYYRDIRAGFNNPPMDDVTFGLLSKAAFERE
jgi:alkylation response protein AidB-like acyl-CoA dehydrogenase